MALDEALLEILVCPIDKRGLLYFADEALLYNPRLRRSYRIENGIPVMLAQQAAPVADDEHARLIERAGSGAAEETAAGSVLSRDHGPRGRGDHEAHLQATDAQPGDGRPGHGDGICASPHSEIGIVETLPHSEEM
jgi:uncharacterized protein